MKTVLNCKAMRKYGLLIGISIAASLTAQAQISIAPHGVARGELPPIGAKKAGSDCLASGCMEFVIKPACFGTNLRAYKAETQLRKNEDVVTEFELANSSDESKKDKLSVRFPSSLTFDTGGVRKACVIDPGQDMSNSDPKIITCDSAEPFKESKYRLVGWKQDRNPRCHANGGSKGKEYCDYAGVILEAYQYAAASPADDPKINCLYTFTNNKIDPGQVSCLFESRLQNMAAQVKISLNGEDISDSADRSGFINRIRTKISGGFNSMNLAPLVRHGQVEPVAPAMVRTQSYQVDREGNKRKIASIIESAGFDSANGNRSYTLEVKYPGAQGFCGGYYSPLMLFFDKELPKFNGVSLFPLYGLEPGQRVNWPEADAPGHFLVDMKGRDQVDSYDQLFGMDDNHSNGFEALSRLDANKDGVLDAKDPAFSQLMLWRDADGNGFSDSTELKTLAEAGVVSINLSYTNRNPTKFGRRATAREKSVFTFKDGDKLVQGEIFDVWFAPID